MHEIHAGAPAAVKEHAILGFQGIPTHMGNADVGARRQFDHAASQQAEAFHVTRGAMTNTLSRLEWAGYIHIRPDWDDARRKFVAISPAGRSARDAALAAFMPRITDVVRDIGAERVRAALPVLRLLRKQLEESLRQDAAGAGAR